MSSHTFTIKPFKRIKLRHAFIALTFGVVSAVLVRLYSSTQEIDGYFIATALFNSLVMFFIIIYQHHQQNKTSDQHTLTITEDSLIFQDFNQQATVSFEQVNKVIFKQPLFGKKQEVLHCLQIKYGPHLRFPAYQKNDELVALINTHLADKVHHLRWFQLSGSPTAHTGLYGLSQFEDKTSQSAPEA